MSNATNHTEPTPAERELAAKIYNDTLAPALHEGSPHRITRIANSLARHRQPAPVEREQPASVAGGVPAECKQPEQLFTAGKLRNACRAGWHSARGEVDAAEACVQAVWSESECLCLPGAVRVAWMDLSLVFEQVRELADNCPTDTREIQRLYDRWRNKGATALKAIKKWMTEPVSEAARQSPAPVDAQPPRGVPVEVCNRIAPALRKAHEQHPQGLVILGAAANHPRGGAMVDLQPADTWAFLSAIEAARRGDQPPQVRRDDGTPGSGSRHTVGGPAASETERELAQSRAELAAVSTELAEVRRERDGFGAIIRGEGKTEPGAPFNQSDVDYLLSLSECERRSCTGKWFRDMAAKVCATLKELAAAREKSVGKWVSVKNQLPTHIHSVVVWVTGGRLVLPGEAGYLDVAIYNSEENRWQAFSGRDDDDIIEVSHWMDVTWHPNQEMDATQPVDAPPARVGNVDEMGGGK